jgi:DNA end-binding protein Ku
MYKGVLGFGLVSIPIQLYKAFDEERIEKHWVHTACGTRVRYQKMCPVCQVTLSSEDMTKAFPLPDGRYVPLTTESESPTDLDHTITILNFHPLQEVDPAFYQQSYWVKPQAGGHKPYRLLVEAMDSVGQVALAQMMLRSKSQLAVVRPFNHAILMLHGMHYPESLRSEGTEITGPSITISDAEREMAVRLIQQMAGPFIPEQYPNQERRRLLEEIERLMPSARTPTLPIQASDEVMDLMAQLRESVARKTGRGQGVS